LLTELEEGIEQLVGWQNERKPLLPLADSHEALYSTRQYRMFMARVDERGESLRQGALYVDFDPTHNVWIAPSDVVIDNSIKERLEWCQARLFKCALNVQSIYAPSEMMTIMNASKLGGAIWRIKIRSKLYEIILRIRLEYAKLRKQTHRTSAL
jgi:hypothetical protein